MSLVMKSRMLVTVADLEPLDRTEGGADRTLLGDRDRRRGTLGAPSAAKPTSSHEPSAGDVDLGGRFR